MIEMIFHFIEGFIILFFSNKLIYKKINYILCIVVAALYALLGYVSDLYLVYNYLLILIALVAVFLVNSILGIKNNSYNLFISVFMATLLSICNSVSIIRILLVLKVNNNTVGFVKDFYYYFSMILSLGLLLGFLLLIDKKKVFKSFEIESKYSLLVSIIALVNILSTTITANNIYTNTISYDFVIFIVILFMISILLLFIVIISINKDNLKLQKQEIELLQLKSIENQYIALNAEKEHNENIKHDLKYFLQIIQSKQDEKVLEEKISGLIEKVDSSITVYSTNKILNSLLVEMKRMMKEKDKNILYNIQIEDIDIKMDDYNNILFLMEEIMDNINNDYLSLNASIQNHYLYLEFIFEPIRKIDYSNGSTIIQNELNNKLMVKYIIKG